jgi:hypothetical protein
MRTNHEGIADSAALPASFAQHLALAPASNTRSSFGSTDKQPFYDWKREQFEDLRVESESRGSQTDSRERSRECAHAGCANIEVRNILVVMPGLVPGIQPHRALGYKDVDGRAFAAPTGLWPRWRDKPGHDGEKSQPG